MTIVPIDQIDSDAVETLLDRAFGADRHDRTAYKVRGSVNSLPDLSFAVVSEGQLLGSMQCWPVALFENGRALRQLIMVGPVAVLPERQNSGIGRQMMDELVDRTNEQTAPMVMIGDEPYYGRWGFQAQPDIDWTLPGPFERHRLLFRMNGNPDLPVRGTLGS